MRRLIVLLVTLVVLAAVVFYFGWIQIKLDQDSYGVIFTKTSGWEEEVIAPGEFTWRVARLLPTNLTLHTFPLLPHSTSATVRGSLPSAAIYGSLLDTPSPFSYVVSVDVIYRLSPDSLPSMARDEGLRSDALTAYYARIDTGIEQLVTETILRQAEEPADLTRSSSAILVLTDSIERALGTSYSGLEIITVSPTRVELPDSALYLETRDRYLSVLDARTTAMREAAARLAGNQAGIDAGLARLERYGEILERYPILLDYFTLTQEFPSDVLELESLIPQPGT